MNKIGTVDPLSLLERKDKWFLGGGKGALYAPPFPRWLESPGFWDESYFADIRLTRLFTVLFCDFAGKPVRLRGEMVSWRPDRMIFEHRGDAHFIRETRVVTEYQEWVSVFELLSGEALMAFVWSLPELKEPGYGTPWQSLLACRVLPEGIQYDFATAWPSELEPDRTGIDAERILNPGVPGMLPPLSLRVALTANQPRLSHTVNLAQRHDDAPLWQTSLLPQKLRDGRLPGDFKLFVGPPPTEGLVHILQQYELSPENPLVVSCQVSPGSPDVPPGRAPRGKDVIAESEQAWRTYFASMPQFNSSDPYLTHAYWYRWYGLRLNTVDVGGMGSLPMRPTTCQVVEEAGTGEDRSADILPKLAADQDQAGPGTHGQAAHATATVADQDQDGLGTHRQDAYATPFITEGIGFFRNFVTYSAQAHLREVAWMHSPRLAIGILENLRKCQRPDGSFPGHNYSCRPARDFYHADFATGAKLAKDLHPEEVHKQHLKALRRYVPYLIKKRKIGWGSEIEVLGEDRLASGTFAVFDQNETGQEYMSRYQFVSDRADQWESFTVGGCDASTYAAKTLFFVGRFFRMYQLNDVVWVDEEDEAGFGLWAHYDEEQAFFTDLALDGTRSPARPATGFYPFLVVSPETYLPCLQRWLFNSNEFWLPKGFPATAMSDPTFSADGEWKGKRLNCPWSGRSWPMVNSHLVDVAATVARWMEPTDREIERRERQEEQSRAFWDGLVESLKELWPEEDWDSESTETDSDEETEEEPEPVVSPFPPGELRAKAAEALMKAITLMFHDGDPSRPNSYEHYDPFTGTPSLYRGYDDYMHSWIVDLIMRHAVGVEPGEDEVDPLPLGVEWIECTEIPHPRGRMHVRIERDQVVECRVEALPH